MPTEPEVPQQLQSLYWFVVAPIATAMTTLMYLLGKRKSGGGEGAGAGAGDKEQRREAEKERERLKAEVAELLRKDERNQTSRDIAIACHEIEEDVERKMAALRPDIEANTRTILKAFFEPLERRLAEIERQIIALKRKRERRTRRQPK